MKNLFWFLSSIAATTLFCSQSYALDIRAAESPTNDLSLTVSTLESAQSSIYLNIYELTSPDITDALIDRIQAGVHVEIIEEGQPVGGLSAAARGIQSQLVSAMEAAPSKIDHLFEMTSKAGGKRRFKYDHAKYAVIDDAMVLIGSENYSPTGNPEPGTLGNRGWEVLIADSGLSQQFESVFNNDKNTASKDVEDLVKTTATDLASRKVTPPKPTTPPTAPALTTFPVLSATAALQLTSPNTSLTGVLNAINSAQKTIDIEQMTFDPNWKGASSSPVLDAVLAAARRGVTVRVLLNDESVFAHSGETSKPKNPVTLAQFASAAQSDGLPISGRIANIKAMGVDYIHNKGMLIDGNQTLISSINWDENSFQNNRETAVLITSSDVFNHYEALFNQDWANSETSSSALDTTELTSSFVKKPKSRESVTDNCPDSLDLTAEIGQISSQDSSTDQDFTSLSGRTISGTFQRSADSSKSCTLSDTDDKTSKQHLFVQIKTNAAGTQWIWLEGYTPKGKLYSVRARLPGNQKVSELTGVDFPAAVFDGSGPGRERLGPATMELSKVK